LPIHEEESLLRTKKEKKTTRLLLFRTTRPDISEEGKIVKISAVKQTEWTTSPPGTQEVGPVADIEVDEVAEATSEDPHEGVVTMAMPRVRDLTTLWKQFWRVSECWRRP
jgi:hypothetical protein